MLERVGTNGVRHTAVEDGVLYGKTIFHDDKALDRNNDIRLSGMLEKGKLGLHENEDIRMAISCPSTLQWQTFIKKHFDTYQLITSKDESERMKGCLQLQLLHPAWVVYSRT